MSEKLPRATHSGPLKIGEIEFDCAVLEDGTRIVSETQFMSSMGIYRSGALSTRRKKRADGAELPLSLSHKNLKPFIEKHLVEDSFGLIKYRSKKGSPARGVPAELIPKVCEVWIDADRAKVLGPTQKLIAARADILLRGFAHVGIVALVDEATGYQDYRNRKALEQILEKFLREEHAKWAKRFPDDFYREIFRLRSWPYRPTSVARPSIIGKYTNDVVYDRLAPGLRRELESLNPRNEKGRRKRRHHQWLTEDVGHPKLQEHLAAVIALMRAATTWDDFQRLLNRALPRQPDLPLFDHLQESGGGKGVA